MVCVQACRPRTPCQAGSRQELVLYRYTRIPEHQITLAYRASTVTQMQSVRRGERGRHPAAPQDGAEAGAGSRAREPCDTDCRPFSRDGQGCAYAIRWDPKNAGDTSGGEQLGKPISKLLQGVQG